MKNKKTHWKKFFDYNYLGSHDLEKDQNLVVTIKEVKKEEIQIPRTPHKESKPVLFFKEDVKPMILKPTNSELITDALGSPHVEDWIGKKVAIYIRHDVKFNGGTVQGLRIKQYTPPVPKSLPFLKADTPEFEKVVGALAKGYKWEDVKKKYTVTDSVMSVANDKVNELKAVTND